MRCQQWESWRRTQLPTEAYERASNCRHTTNERVTAGPALSAAAAAVRTKTGADDSADAEGATKAASGQCPLQAAFIDLLKKVSAKDFSATL